jgi:hypothetical protein
MDGRLAMLLALLSGSDEVLLLSSGLRAAAVFEGGLTAAGAASADETGLGVFARVIVRGWVRSALGALERVVLVARLAIVGA